jgi:hypothetical protein
VPTFVVSLAVAASLKAGILAAVIVGLILRSPRSGRLEG